MYYTSKTKIQTLQRVFVMLLLLLPTILFSQITVSNISGSVKDDNGKPVSGAEITATNIPTGTQYKTVSGKSGLYYIANVNPGGPYRINTIIHGEEVVAEIPYINVGQEGVAILNANMKNTTSEENIGNIKMTNLSEIKVSAQNVGINKSGPSQSFDKQQINAITSIKRSVQDFVGLNSYVTNNWSFAGRDAKYNNITVDGASLNNNFGLAAGLAGGGNVQPISLDAIDQMSIQIAPFDIRQSNFTGGAINLVTKGGTNTIHGTVYGFYRNQSFNGNKASGLKLSSNKSTFANYGFNVGGPILKNKLFYFLSFEGELTQTPYTNIVPTGTSSPITSSVSPQDLDALSAYLYQTYGYNTGGYNLSRNTSANYKVLARIDWNINAKNKLMVRYNFVQGLTNVLPSGSTMTGVGGLSNSRLSNSSYSYLNTTYGVQNTVQSVVLDLKSSITDKLSNQFLATYATDNMIRKIPGGQNFPTVDIMSGTYGNATVSSADYISFGTELFTYHNALKTNTMSIQDNFTANLGEHTIVAGVGFDLLNFSNSYMPGGASYYRYNSIQDFERGSQPTVFGITYAYPGVKDPAAKANFGQAYAYIQDEWKITDYFKIMGAIRMDVPIYMGKLLANNAVNNLTGFLLPASTPLAGTTVNAGTPMTMNVSKWPNTIPLFSPRLSFTYDVLKDKSLIIRGGAGIFTGRIPFVWLVGIPNNSGTLQYIYGTNGDPITGMTFQTDPSYYLTHPFNVKGTQVNLPTTPNVPSLITSFDPKFKMPQVLRVNLAVDYTFANDFTATVEALYTKDINQVLVYNTGLTNPTGSFFDNRAMWWDPAKLALGTLSTQPYVLPTASNGTALANPIYVTNTNKGGGISFTAGLTKKFSKNWLAGASYTYTYYQEITSNSGTQLSSMWNTIPSKNGQNYLPLASSSYAIPHKVTAFVNYSIDYAKYFGTSLTLSYVGAPQGRYSYVYSGDVNGDKQFYDLIYIPKNESDIQFADYTPKGSTLYTKEQQAKDFWAYVNNDKYLRTHKGQTAQRNAGIFPWWNQLNFRVLQNFYFYTGKIKHTLQVSYEIVNVLNLLNQNWGNTWYLNAGDGFNSVPLAMAGYNPTTQQPIFNYTNGLGRGSNEKYNNKTITPSTSINSVWQMNIGVRYIF